MNQTEFKPSRFHWRIHVLYPVEHQGLTHLICFQTERLSSDSGKSLMVHLSHLDPGILNTLQLQFFKGWHFNFLRKKFGSEFFREKYSVSGLSRRHPTREGDLDGWGRCGGAEATRWQPERKGVRSISFPFCGDVSVSSEKNREKAPPRSQWTVADRKQ